MVTYSDLQGAKSQTELATLTEKFLTECGYETTSSLSWEEEARAIRAGFQNGGEDITPEFELVADILETAAIRWWELES